MADEIRSQIWKMLLTRNHRLLSPGYSSVWRANWRSVKTVRSLDKIGFPEIAARYSAKAPSTAAKSARELEKRHQRWYGVSYHGYLLRSWRKLLIHWSIGPPIFRLRRLWSSRLGKHCQRLRSHLGGAALQPRYCPMPHELIPTVCVMHVPAKSLSPSQMSVLLVATQTFQPVQLSRVAMIESKAFPRVFRRAIRR